MAGKVVEKGLGRRSFRAGLKGSCATVLAALLIAPVYGQVSVEEEPQAADFPQTSLGLDAVNTPVRGADSPLTNTFTLNGATLDFGLTASVTAGAFAGDNRSIEFLGNGIFGFGSTTEAETVNNIGIRRQSGWFVSLRAVDRSRTVETRRRTPVELIGFNLDLTVTGKCVVPGAEPDTFCTYTPGLTVGPEDIDPETLLPFVFRTDSAFGQQIDVATHEALKAEPDVFSRGDPTLEERVGISLQIPNAGTLPDETRINLSSFDREERVRQRLMFSVSKVDQTLKSSDTEATLDRTTRSFVLLDRDEWDKYSIATQLAAWILPGASSSVSSAGGAPRGDISNNLFFAANNVRVPANSFTMFQTGSGRVQHTLTPPRNPDETPTVFFNSFWMGVSPVRDVSRSNGTRFSGLEDRRLIRSAYREGSISSGLGELDDVVGRITIIDDIAREITTLELSNIVDPDIYVQVGIDFTRQRAIEEVLTRQTSRFRYVPHFSFTGNRTDGRSVLRYYAGLIDPAKANFYIGSDYTWLGANGIRFAASAAAYSRPDRDYFSNAAVSVSQTTRLNDSNLLTYGISGRLEIDRVDALTDARGVGTNGDQVEVFGQLQNTVGAFTARARASNLRSGNSTQAISLGAALPVFDGASLTLEGTPYATENSYIQFRTGLSVPISAQAGSPVLRAQYARIKYDFGSDAFGQSQRATENTFLATIQVNF
jgi:hypothetical protein